MESGRSGCGERRHDPGGQFVLPRFGSEREEGWTDFNDLHCAEGLEVVRAQVMAVVRPPAEGGWRDCLLRIKGGGLAAHMVNISLILQNDERWHGVLGYDEFSAKTMKLRTPPYGGGTGSGQIWTTCWRASGWPSSTVC